MGDSGYNRPDSTTWHSAQRCSGTTFTALESMDSHIAENRGLRPCGNCCGGVWPHEETDDDADRDTVAWAEEKMEPGETAIKLTSRTWNGPEYICADAEGNVHQWPVGLGKNLAEVSTVQFEQDMTDEYVTAEAVEFEGTPLTEYDRPGWSE
jgi:hypothetical protein